MIEDSTSPLRPVQCWYCDQQMHYAGQPEHEPEVRVDVAGDAGEATMYLHARCWNEWQRRRRPVDILAEYGRTDGRREWVSVATWLRPGEVVALIDDPRPNVGGEARLAAHQPSHTTTATPQGVASTDELERR